MAIDAWKNFELSGKVSDYLAYRQSTNALDEKAVRLRGADGAAFLEKGTGTYGTGHCGDGNGIKCHANRGV